MPPRRIIFHVDMDAFYASIEQRDRPELRGRPVIVGGPTRRGVVSTASYEARPFGVHSAMPMAEAVRRCPHAIVVPVRMAHYVSVSRQLMDVLHRFSPLVEPLSLDEAFLDMSGTEGLHGPAPVAARAIKDQIHAATSLTCSVGVADNKFLAKLASDLDKPDAITIVPAGQGRAFIAKLPLRRLWGVGPRSAERLESLEFRTIGDVAEADPRSLARLIGESQGEHLQALARGQDDRPVVPDREAKSIGSEETLAEDIRGTRSVAAVLRRHCDRVAERLRAAGLQARSVRVKVRYSRGFRLMTREGPLPEPCDDSRTLRNTATALLAKLDLNQPIRLVGVAAAQLDEAGAPMQGDLFEHASTEKNSRLEHALDSIRDRFGDVIKRADD
ncbi:MAG: DNA polymerase IV [Myxococcota bacterium]